MITMLQLLIRQFFTENQLNSSKRSIYSCKMKTLTHADTILNRDTGRQWSKSGELASLISTNMI